jgi:hypothetical protein
VITDNGEKTIWNVVDIALLKLEERQVVMALVKNTLKSDQSITKKRIAFLMKKYGIM